MHNGTISSFDLGRLFFHFCRDHRRHKGLQTRYGIADDLLWLAWSLDTAAPWAKGSWSNTNRSMGQSDVTSLVVQDLMGGTIVRADTALPDGIFFNWLPNGEDVYPFNPCGRRLAPPVHRASANVDRRDLLANSALAIAERYELLKSRLADAMRTNGNGT
jgi:hypothetical protein